MKPTTMLALRVVFGTALGVAGLAFAQSGGNYVMQKQVIGAGAAVANGGGHTLTGTVGQTDAAPAMQGNGYSLHGGFWAAGSCDSHADAIFCNGFE